MLVDQQDIDLVFKSFQTVYRDSYDKAPILYGRIAMTVPNESREEAYGWIGQFPNLHEWIGLGQRRPSKRLLRCTIRGLGGLDQEKVEFLQALGQRQPQPMGASPAASARPSMRPQGDR